MNTVLENEDVINNIYHFLTFHEQLTEETKAVLDDLINDYTIVKIFTANADEIKPYFNSITVDNYDERLRLVVTIGNGELVANPYAMEPMIEFSSVVDKLRIKFGYGSMLFIGQTAIDYDINAVISIDIKLSELPFNNYKALNSKLLKQTKYLDTMKGAALEHFLNTTKSSTEA
jgi:hypothetical protein